MSDFKRSGKKRFGSRDRDSDSGSSFSRPKRFNARNSSGSGWNSGRGDSDERPRRDSGRSFPPSRRTGLGMHEVTCDKCGKTCEVPFKPTGNKPVFCSDCFRKNDERSSSRRAESFDSSGSSGRSGISPADLEAIHEKLDLNAEEIESLHEKIDKIMKALNVEQD